MWRKWSLFLWRMIPNRGEQGGGTRLRVTWTDQTQNCSVLLPGENPYFHELPGWTTAFVWSSGTLRHKSAKSSPRATVLPPTFSGYEGYPQGYGNRSDNVSEPALLGYLVPWIIFCCCSRISSKPKPLVSSGSSKSHGLGPPRLAPPVIRLDLRTRLQALRNSKSIALLQITPTSAEGASLACFENSIRLQFIACLVYASNCVQCWKRYADK